MTCSCSRLHVGSTVTEARNWNPDCGEHGVESEWYRSDEQIAKRKRQDLRTRALQRLARIKRRQASAASER